MSCEQRCCRLCACAAFGLSSRVLLLVPFLQLELQGSLGACFLAAFLPSSEQAQLLFSFLRSLFLCAIFFPVALRISISRGASLAVRFHCIACASHRAEFPNRAAFRARCLADLVGSSWRLSPSALGAIVVGWWRTINEKSGCA